MTRSRRLSLSPCASITRSSSCPITTTSRASSILASALHGITFHDYASPITEPIEKRWIARHRLQKKDPSAAVSEPVKPIVYYVDNGAPEPIRSALVEGASWWNAAFEAAGFKNAFQVKMLPGRRRPDGPALQHDQLGASLDARLVVWRERHRSAHRARSSKAT